MQWPIPKKRVTSAGHFPKRALHARVGVGLGCWVADDGRGTGRFAWSSPTLKPHGIGRLLAWLLALYSVRLLPWFHPSLTNQLVCGSVVQFGWQKSHKIWTTTHRYTWRMELMTDLITDGSLLAGVCARTLLQIYARSLGDGSNVRGAPEKWLFLWPFGARHGAFLNMIWPHACAEKQEWGAGN